MPANSKCCQIEQTPGVFPQPAYTNADGDFFIGNKIITDLNSENFDCFLRDKEMVMVMFYEPFNPDCCISKKHLQSASISTFRKNHAYAALNCKANAELCMREEAYILPKFKVYTYGKLVNVFEDYTTFNSKEMRKFMTSAPAVPM